MAISIAQYVDLLFKKLQGVAKTANAATKSASNESIASPPLLRGDVVWMQSDKITATAGAIVGIANARINSNSVQCAPDTTVPPIGGIRPTWLSNVSYWIPQEFGATWLPKIYVGPASAANIQATGTQIFSAGISGAGEYYFDTQAGVLNFIGETIPAVLTAGNVVYVAGYEYVGALGVTNNPGNLTLGNLTVANTTVSTTLANGNITLTATGNGLVAVTGVSGIVIPSGNTDQRPTAPAIGTVRFNTFTQNLETYTGNNWVAASSGGNTFSITNQTISPDGSSLVYALDQAATSPSVLLTINGINQTPDIDYSVVGNVLTMSSPPESTDLIQVRYLTGLTTISALTNSVGNAIVSVAYSGNIDLQPSSGHNVNVVGNIVGNYFIGNGSQLTGIPTSYGNSNVVTLLGNLGSNAISTTGNISGGNIIGNGSQLTGIVSSYGNSNVTTLLGNLGSNAISTTGNVTFANISGTLTTSSQPNITSTGTLVSLTVTGNITGSDIVGTLNGSGSNISSINASNISYGTLNQLRLANSAITVNGTSISLGGSASITATATNALTIGSGLNGTSYNGSSAVTITNAGVLSLANGGGITASATSGAITLGSTATSAATAGAIVARDVSGNFSANTVTVTGINNSNSNAVGNIGSSSTYFNTVFAKATSAQYADLAEKYTSDQTYAPGTVLVFGGASQVTECTNSEDHRAAGVVSTLPAHLMNAELPDVAVAVALAGQVPCCVVGPVSKGDVLTTSTVAGHAHTLDFSLFRPGCVIGKALEDCGTGLHKILISVAH